MDLIAPLMISSVSLIINRSAGNGYFDINELMVTSCGFESRRLFNRRRGEIGRRGQIPFSFFSVYYTIATCIAIIRYFALGARGRGFESRRDGL